MSSKLMKKMWLKAFLSLGVMAAVLMEMAAAANYTVGSPGGGWDQSTDLQAWASSITFVEGDNLIFGYTTNHDVTEVSKPDFDSCTASSPLQPPRTGGAAVIPLTSAGSRYFICGTGGHCISGMKLAITTLATSSPPAPPAAAPPPSTAPAVPSPPPQPSTTPAVPSPPPSKTTAPSPPPPPPSATVPAPPLSGSVLPPPPPAPSAAAKFDVMGSLTGLILMVLFVNVF